MRYYNIVLTNAQSGATVRQYTSFQNGKTLPGALNVELDIYAINYAASDITSYVRIWGIPLADIAQAASFSGLNIVVSGGMQKGLPLANPAQAGVLAQGQVLRSYGNWIGTDMTLDLQISPSVGMPSAPINHTLTWRKGQTLASALTSTLNTAYPGYTVQMAISPSLVLGYDEVGYYGSLDELSAWVMQKSQDVIGGKYPGVNIAIVQKTIRVSDQTTQSAPRQISFTDLIGQPTWIDVNTIQVKTVMRADLSVQDYVKLPPSLVTTAAQGASNLLGTSTRSSSVFQGAFQVLLVRHVGNFRQPDAASWASVYNCVPAQAAA